MFTSERSPATASFRNFWSALLAFWFIPELPFIDADGFDIELLFICELLDCACAADAPSASAAATPIASFGFLLMISPHIGLKPRASRGTSSQRQEHRNVPV